MIDKQIIIDEINKTIEQEMENLRNIAKQQIGKLEAKLKAKEQECEELKEKYKWFDHYKEQALYNKNLCNEKSEQFDQLKAENEKMSKGYAELAEIVSPYIDDFTGYNEKLGGFDIVLCVKELL